MSLMAHSSYSRVVDASDEDHKAYQKHLDDNVMATCIMLASMSQSFRNNIRL